jgi:hypothetical protein
MSESHAIAGPARGDCLPTDRVGACVRLPLDGPPTPRWSDALTARLATALTGHPAVGHLRLNRLVQGNEIVLDGVEAAEADVLGPVLREAIAAANRTCGGDQRPAIEAAANIEQHEADRLARTVEAGVRRP